MIATPEVEAVAWRSNQLVNRREMEWRRGTQMKLASRSKKKTTRFEYLLQYIGHAKERNHHESRVGLLRAVMGWRLLFEPVLSPGAKEKRLLFICAD